VKASNIGCSGFGSGKPFVPPLLSALTKLASEIVSGFVCSEVLFKFRCHRRNFSYLELELVRFPVNDYIRNTFPKHRFFHVFRSVPNVVRKVGNKLFHRVDTVTIVSRMTSLDFPVTPAAFDTSSNGGWDCFVTKLILRTDTSDEAHETDALLPSQLLLTIYPNPFNATTSIEYFLPQDCFVCLSVYDVLGESAHTW